MSLSKYNVTERLEELIGNYFSGSQRSFSDLKNLVTSQQPLSEVHQVIVRELSDAKAIEQQQVMLDLEADAIKGQIGDDRSEVEIDTQHQKRDDESQSALLREQVNKAESTSALKQNILTLELFLSAARPAVQVVHEHGAQPTTVHTHAGDVHTHGHSSTVHRTFAANSNARSLSIMRAQLANMEARSRDITRELEQIRQRTTERNQRRHARDAREQARLAGAEDSAAGVVLEDALSRGKLSALALKKRRARDELSSLCDRLATEATEQNYELFIKHLRQHLAKNSLNEDETRALHSVITLIEQHRQHSKNALSLKKDLERHVQALRGTRQQLAEHERRLQELQAANPGLSAQNETLASEIQDLTAKREQNNNSVNRLITPSLIIGATSLAAAIPLALTLAGIIPYVLAPTLLITLFAAPPAVLLLTALTLAVMAIVYAAKSSSNSASIVAKQEIVDGNISKTQKNDEVMSQLTQRTIPARRKEIASGEQRQADLSVQLHEQERLAAQTLQQAKATEPQRSGYFPAQSFFAAPDEANTSAVKPSAPPAPVDGEPDYSSSDAEEPTTPGLP